MKVDFAKLDRAFSPKCVVVVGDSVRNEFNWLKAQKEFKGKLYSVQVNPETIKQIEAMGVKNYTSLLDIPDQIDLVIVSVPRVAAMKILEDCIRKDVGAVHFFTSGFAETDTEEGRQLERQFVARATEANLHVIGPNCMGVFNPKVGVKQTENLYSGVSGPVGCIAQSGTHAIAFASQAHLEGVNVAKSVSFGNGIVLDSPDYLEYFAHDPEIKVIAMYLEGVRDGPRFLRVLKNVTAQKPVVIWKGGRTEEGGRAIASHTGSLAVSRAIWDTAVKQCGAIGVRNIEELIDTTKALVFLPPVRGLRVGIAGGSGGQSVAIADVFAEAGLKVPTLSPESYKELSSFFSLIGGSYRNPVDTGNPNQDQMRRIMEILERDANLDNLALLMTARWIKDDQLDAQVKMLTELRQKTDKPIIMIVFYHTPEDMQKAIKIAERFQAGGVPAFSSMERGARTLKNAFEYYQMKKSVELERRYL
ncbi:MAG: CoA-binding protein [Chloroflexota bacterium]